MSPLDAFSTGGMDAVGRFGLDARGLGGDTGPTFTKCAVFIVMVDQADQEYLERDFDGNRTGNYTQWAFDDRDYYLDVHQRIADEITQARTDVAPVYSVWDHRTPDYYVNEQYGLSRVYVDTLGGSLVESNPGIKRIQAAREYAGDVSAGPWHVLWDTTTGLSYIEQSITSSALPALANIDLVHVGIYIVGHETMPFTDFYPEVQNLQQYLHGTFGSVIDFRTAESNARWLFMLSRLAEAYYFN